MTRTLHMMFSGGGTGGHLFPGLAVAEQISHREPSCRITFCGTGKEWERSLVAKAGFEYAILPAAPLVASPMGLLRAVISNGIGYRNARRSIRIARPTVVVGLGGYSSVPLGLAAARATVPLVLLEQNSIPGRANRFLSRWATAMYLTFEQSADYFAIRPGIETTGNPVRSSIVDRAAARGSRHLQAYDAEPTLVILGGSQGANSLNRHVTDALPQVAEYLGDWHIVHQTGAKDAAWVAQAYETHQVRATVTPFVSDMAGLLARATLAIARAGATTLAELAVMSVPAILLPYPFATNNHQWHNAQIFGRSGAAMVLDDRPQPGRSASALASALVPLLRLPELRREMRLAMLQLARPDAAAIIADRLLMLISERRPVRQSA